MSQGLGFKVAEGRLGSGLKDLRGLVCDSFYVHETGHFILDGQSYTVGFQVQRDSWGAPCLYVYIYSALYTCMSVCMYTCVASCPYTV